MSERNEYLEKIKAKIDEWNADIEKLQAKARQAEAEARIRYHDQIEELRRQRNRAEENLKEARGASEEAFREMRTRLEGAWDDISKAFRKAVDRFK
ncbi:hypothetical protein [Alkalilimnicola ehrlichii]|uniref:hypothetical protein n=1 Tax=Alkalilimnicola ehrlichii TaxID=351052 RepID=UPI003BA3B619